MDYARPPQTPQTPTSPKTFRREGSTTTSTSPLATGQPPASQVTSNNSGDSTNTSTSNTITPKRVHLHSPPQHPNLRSRRLQRRHSPYHHPKPSHREKFQHLLRPLYPLVSIETGLAHPDFPKSLLQYHLLNHSQLDELAAHYHQLQPSYYSLGYPAAVVGRWGARGEEDVVQDQHFEALIEEAKDALGVVRAEMGVPGREVTGSEEAQVVEDKRRRFGRFMGMRNCESPGLEDEGIVRAAVEAWVAGEMARMMAEEREREGLMKKGTR